jgi:hypothetical protein
MPHNSPSPVEFVGTAAEWARLPLDLSQFIKQSGMPRLVWLRTAIGADAGLPMPPVQVAPYGWADPESDFVFFGLASLWKVAVPASTLLVIDEDEVLREILVREFDHCFASVMKAVRFGRRPANLSAAEPSKAKVREMLARDNEFLTDPEPWFGAHDVNRFLQHNGEPLSPSELEKAALIFDCVWQCQGYPVRMPALTYSASTSSIPRVVRERAELLLAISFQ